MKKFLLTASLRSIYFKAFFFILILCSKEAFSQPCTPPVINAPSVTQPTCALPSGSIIIFANGTGQLEYSLNGTTWQASNIFSNLTPGNYNITVRLKNNPGCFSVYSANPVVINALPVVPTINAPDVTQPTCAVHTGTIIINATGAGTLEYSLDGSTWETSDTFTDLVPGSYNILVRLQTNPTCVSPYSGNPVIIAPVPATPTFNFVTITQPDCAISTGTIVMDVTGSGTLEYSIDETNWQTSNTFIGVIPGEYYISARLQASPTCVTYFNGNPVVINAVPVPPIINTLAITQPTCAVPAGTISIDAIGIAAVEYSINGTDWQASNTFTDLAPGDYTVFVRLKRSTNCIATYSGNPVTINNIPVAPTVNAPIVTQPTCAIPGGTIVISATGNGTLEYSVDGTNWQTSNTFSNLTPGDYIISARLQSSPTCETAYIGNPITIDAIPVAPTVNAPTITQPTCDVPTGTIAIDATGIGDLEYSIDGTTWRTSNMVSDLAPGNYNILVRLLTNPTCITSYSGNPVAINIAPVTPSVNTVGDQTICTNAATTTVSFTGSPLGTVYNWTNNTTSIGLAASGSGDIASFTAINNGSTPVTATITVIPSFTNAGGTCIGSSTSFTITINPKPIVNPVADQTICDGGTTLFTVTASATPGTFTYQWQIDQGSGFTDIADLSPFSGATTSTLTVSGATTAYNGNHIRVVVTNACGSTNSNAAILTVNSLPTITVTPDGSCSPATLTATGADTYNWSPATGLSATTGATVTATTNVNTDYTVTGIVAATGCENSTTVSVLGSVSSAVLTGTAGICPGGAANLKVAITGGTSPYTVVYSNGTSNFTVNGYITGTDISVSPSATTTYTLISVAGANGCAGSGLSGNVVITVNPVPVISITPDNQCGPVTLTASGTSNTYAWSPAAGLNTTTGATVIANPTVNTIYIVTGTITATGCQGSATVNVNATPAAPVVTPSADTICLGSISTLTASTTANAAVWAPVTNLYTDAAATIPYTVGMELNTVYAKPATTANYNVTTSTSTCTSASTKVTVTVLQPISITGQPVNKTVCQQSNASFAVHTAGGSLPSNNFQKYQWQVNADTTDFVDIANANDSILVLTAVDTSLSGNQYRVIISNKCFADTSGAASLTVNALPVVTAAPLQNKICISDTLITLTGTPIGGTWSGAGVSGSDFIPTTTTVGAHTLTYSYTNTLGCTATATIVANVESCPERLRTLDDNAVIIYPNPNNGRFNIRINSALFNRLGIRVYNSQGALITTKEFSGLVYGRVIPVDLTYLSADVYMVKFYYDNGTQKADKTFKVIIGRH